MYHLFYEACEVGNLAVAQYFYDKYRDNIVITNNDDECFEELLLKVAHGELTDWFFGLNRAYTEKQMRWNKIAAKDRKGGPDRNYYQFCKNLEKPENRAELEKKLEMLADGEYQFGDSWDQDESDDESSD